MFIGIDIGTQSLKAVIADSRLRVRARASRDYSFEIPQAGWAEQDVSLWEVAVAEVVRQLVVDADVSPRDIAALAVCGQLDGCVPVDARGEAVGPALIWMDRRATEHVPAVLPDDFEKRTGVIADAGHMAAKISWCLANGRGERFHQPVSYLVERLTGEFVFDPAIASTTMVFDFETNAIESSLCELFGFARRRLPRVELAHHLAGTLTPAAAERIGLTAGTPVAVGTGDDFATPLGAGVFDSSSIVCVLGTAEVVGAVSTVPLFDDARLVECHAYPGQRFFIENPGWLAGGSIAWARELLGFSSDAELDAAAAASPLVSDPLLFLPALTGAMAPRWRASARGCFYGLSPRHTRGHLARAVLEGCAFAMYDVVSRLHELGISPSEIVALGGGAASDAWLQMRADLAGVAVRRAPASDHCALGAALLAAVSCGSFSSIEEAIGCLDTAGQVFVPHPKTSQEYRPAHARYRRLFDALEPMFDDSCA